MRRRSSRRICGSAVLCLARLPGCPALLLLSRQHTIESRGENALEEIKTSIFENVCPPACLDSRTDPAGPRGRDGDPAHRVGHAGPAAGGGGAPGHVRASACTGMLGLRDFAMAGAAYPIMEFICVKKNWFLITLFSLRAFISADLPCRLEPCIRAHPHRRCATHTRHCLVQQGGARCG
jgi:hypothetical protein